MNDTGVDVQIPDPVPSDDQNQLEKIFDSQSTTITELEDKLKKILEEKQELESLLKTKESEYTHKEDALIQRYINAEFRLAQLSALLPVKRIRPTKNTGNGPSVIRSDDSPRICSTKHLNPAINLVYKKIHEATKEAQTRVKQSNDDLLAWKFAPDSASGKRLMSRVRQLLSANEELGRVNQTDRVANLEAEAEVQSTCVKEFMKTNQGMESVLNEAYTDLEGLQSSLLIIRQQIDQAESLVQELQDEFEARRPGQVAELLAAVLANLTAEGNQLDSEVGQLGPDDQSVPADVEMQDYKDTVNDQDVGMDSKPITSDTEKDEQTESVSCENSDQSS